MAQLKKSLRDIYFSRQIALSFIAFLENLITYSRIYWALNHQLIVSVHNYRLFSIGELAQKTIYFCTFNFIC